MSEAAVHFKFHHYLLNAIGDDPQRGSRTYERVEPEYSEDIDGRADLVVFDDNEPVLVIEAKRPDGASGREIDPYSPVVIRQAHGYASELGSPFFATYNGERMVLFKTHEEGVPLLQRSTKSYNIEDAKEFASTLLDEISRLEEGNANWDSLDDAFIERIRSLHEQLKPELQTALAEELENSEFHGSFSDWAGAQGIEYDDMSGDRQQEVRERFAEEAAYLLANKIMFYKILEDAPAYSGEVRPLAIRENHVRDDLEMYFGEVVDNVDFEAVFDHDEIYSEIPLSHSGQRISEFIDELDDQDLTQFDSDVIGRIYEGVIPPERRHDLGEYYTPPAICDLITQLTVQEADDRVLDPACGSGGFPVSAYHRKRDLLSQSAGSHERVLEEIYGIDINRFPAHLTAINLAIQELSTHTENVHVEVSDFFNVNPDVARFGRTAASASGSEYEHDVDETLGGFDAVVGNPPYIRQENIDDKERIREHLSNDNVDGESLSRRSDIYSYFFTHGTEFLRDGGRLGFITSDRWLDTGYGADLQEFLLDNYRIDAVVKFDTQAFDDALIGSTVVILTKDDNTDRRDDHTAKFLRVKRSLDIDEVTSIITDDRPSDQLVRTDDYRLVTRTQRTLYDEEKWNLFFSAPPIYFEILSNEVMSLDDVADVGYGVKSGANQFFIHSGEEMEQLGLGDYSTPLLKASGQMERIEFGEEDADEWEILDVHDLVEDALSETGDELSSSPAHRIKDWLSSNGHEDLVEYIEWGEEQEFDTRSTCQQRSIWFDLGDLTRSNIMMPRFTWRQHRVIWNEVGGVGTTQFYNVVCRDSIDEKLLCGILNSRVVWLASELQGRGAGGQGMNRSELKVYEAKQLTLPNLQQVTDREKERIIDALDALMRREDELEEEAVDGVAEAERDELDKAVLATLDMEDRLDDLKDAVSGLVAMRERGSGEQTRVLVDRPEEREVVDLAGVSDARESTTLGDF